MKEINNNNFNDETKEGIVLVDFWANWCGPCKMLTPVLEQLSGEMKEVKFFKVNVDENGELAQQFRIASIPTVMIFKDGEVVDKMMGFRPKNQVEEFLKKHI